MNRTHAINISVTTIALVLLGAAARGQEGKYRAAWGTDLQSRYSVSKDDIGNQLMSPRLFDPHGDPRSEPGRIVAYSVVKPDPDGTAPIGQTPQTINTDGKVWTPRAETIGELDLSQPGRISDQASSDLVAFGRHPAVVTFDNGFAVNLYGAKCQDDKIVGAGTEGTYLTDNGRALPARLLRPLRTPGTQVHPGDTIVTVSKCQLMDGRRVVGAVKPYAMFRATAVNGKWVKVSVHRKEGTVKGWINVENLAGQEARWEEVVLDSK
jgi:hypothetical protein